MDIAFPCLFFWQFMRDRAREEGQQETNALRVYLGNVEAAAASLVTRIQELQHLLALSSAVQQGQDVDQLRGKVATEATKEARNHAASAAQAISAAREATMELDKVKRDSYALTTAQAAEIERLCAETADYHTICEVLHLDQISKTLEHGHSNLKTSIRC
jgi:acyl-homoserine lactone acylase PvdQ